MLPLQYLQLLFENIPKCILDVNSYALIYKHNHWKWVLSVHYYIVPHEWLL